MISAPRQQHDDDLERALGDIAADLALATPAHGPVPSVMVAAVDDGVPTTNVAFDLGAIAAGLGMRVLVVEGPRPKSLLATEADPNGEPMLVDVCGELRLVLQTAEIDGLFVAPLFRHGRGIAAALARNAQAKLIEEIAAEFNIVVIDGADAEDAAMGGLSADAYLRVGRDASRAGCERLVRTFGASEQALLGTVAGVHFVPRDIDRQPVHPVRLRVVAETGPGLPRTAGKSQVVMPWARPAYPRRVSLR